MEVKAFLTNRLNFIRSFYDTAAAPFLDTMRKIEDGEAPFEPPYSEDDEPPFLTEWMDAQTGLDMLGRACVSMLSASLKLYFQTWEKELSVKWEKGERKRAFKNGFFHGYKTCFGESLNLSWRDCPADLAILEQVTLARNRDQHPNTITKMGVEHTPFDMKKHPSLFFATEWERKECEDPELSGVTWLNPSVYVSRDALFIATNEVEKLAAWLEQNILNHIYNP